ncbi:DoxX family membrane protein [Corynebacterium amycolatum]|uniref:MauE/DoxX family redox-associated membrane protein n=1 Tax=Corynebacterium amycolatum TaxID=43765 RepID=UPI00211A71A2|nr:MauE/DoxX family redox-associated membrane protein [Corynebacterium amycolatum]MCQ9127675.1 DoxX family membrane protein [Corynebacterium amycolatum]MCQ9141531.1 DoxX family membrane protein [Corynebacterium amycolatum]MCQ9168530.1 DoxX family membrane protein [Corynebacterium amycolatum]MCQ9176137.1 DoxX family membrane protein [Corynebacterium amycolatum]
MKNFVGVVARFGLAAVWLYSGLIKLLNPLESRQAVQAYELLPSDLVPMVAVALPTFEVILGLLLVLGLFLRPVAVLSGLLLLAFIGGIISAWARGLQIDCGCFGGGGYDENAGPATYLTEIARDIGFLALAVFVYVWPWKKFAIYA